MDSPLTFFEKPPPVRSIRTCSYKTFYNTHETLNVLIERQNLQTAYKKIFFYTGQYVTSENLSSIGSDSKDILQVK